MFRPIESNQPGLVIVHRAWGRMEAEVIKGRLESAGIPALLDYESAGQVIGVIIDGLGEVRVLVPQAQAKDARLALSQTADQADWDALPDDQPREKDALD